MAWPTSTFPTTLDTITDTQDNTDVVLAADINGAYDCIEKLQAKVGVNDSAVSTSHDYRIKAIENAADIPIPSGTKMLFYANTAPTGWTIDNTLDDKLIYVTKGSVAGGQSGGGVHSTGTWTQPNHTHTGPSHTHTGPSHTHTGPSHAHTTPAMTLDVTQIPAHTHIIPRGGVGGLEGWERASNQGGNGTNTTTSTGSGASHAHGDTGAAGTGASGASGTGASGTEGTGATGNGATANTWRPAAYCMIICSKN
jgi:hypothetical protein